MYKNEDSQFSIGINLKENENSKKRPCFSLYMNMTRYETRTENAMSYILCKENFFCINKENVNVCHMIEFVLLTQYIIKQFVGEAEFYLSSCMQYLFI